MLKYSDLKQSEKDFISNGCGAKNGFIKVPDFIFIASCNKHDFYFYLGNTWKLFFRANRKFYKYMRLDIKNSNVSFFKKSYYHFWALNYFNFVSLGGSKYFNFSDTPKTLNDLKKEMITKKVKTIKSNIKASK